MCEISTKRGGRDCNVLHIGGNSSACNLVQHLLVAELFARLDAELAPERVVVGVLPACFRFHNV